MGNSFKFDWVVVEKVAYKRPAPVAPNGPGLQTNSFEGTELVSSPPMTRLETMTIAEADEEFRADNVAATLVNMPVALIEPLQRSITESQLSVPLWGLRDIGADRSPYKGEGVVVAVLDTGIDADHVAFDSVRDKIISYNFTGDGSESDVKDENGHGTHCAGTICGGEVGGHRIGVAPNVQRLLVGKVLGKTSGGDTRTLVRALSWAQFNGADVISMSLGMDFSGFLKQLMEHHRLELKRAASIALEAFRLNLEMFNKLSNSVIGVPGLVEGTLVVGAAGNESDFPNYRIAASLPSSALDFVSVAALSPPAGANYELAPFSNIGAKLGAPGVEILSANSGGGLAAMDGTSMATPHVAGAACLWIQKLREEARHGNRPDASIGTVDVIESLKASAAQLNPGISKEDVQWGRVMAPVVGA